jgi:Flp pilus assembly protein TadD
MQATWRRITSRKRPRARYGNLIAFIRERLMDEPGDVRLRQSLATHLSRAGRYGEAIEEAERLLEIAPGHAEAKRLLLEIKLHRLLRGDQRP